MSPNTRINFGGGYFRDLAFIKVSRNRCMAVACDAVGGLGPKPDDVERMSAETIGYFCARVVLLELLSIRATPQLAVCTLSVELYPTGELLLQGVRQLFREEGFSNSIAMITSTETNFPTRHTAMGITLLGQTRTRFIKRSTIEPKDVIYRVGVPRIGLRLGDPDILPVSLVRKLTRIKGVREVIPLGSRGAASELRQLRSRGIEVRLSSRLPQEELNKSCGPSNAVLVVAPRKASLVEEISQVFISHPVLRLGTVTHTSSRRLLGRRWSSAAQIQGPGKVVHAA